ncbi:RNB domain-containing ribonuclease [Hoyosella sp. G463]|uniref:RNB domain-containing ribonuclease n=2 Tax=Lolliginicoccus lacisalsi TaxID=2742202 RepID=A0A927J9F2_9ACTN|nr:RNB domain-containing ribonuclease [Lolliginicoccus lacisalsi]
MMHLASVDSAALRDATKAVKDELDVPDGYPPGAEAEAAAAVDRCSAERRDATSIPLVTIDPPGSRDLDQALDIERHRGGYRVHYAIADVAALIEPGGALDKESQRRGETWYGPDMRIPLHPAVLSEGAASLLPGKERLAVLWTIDLDAEGDRTSTHVERARVRSREQLDYQQAQHRIDSGARSHGSRPDDPLGLLAEVGRLRLEQERARGGVSLPLPDQTIHTDGDAWTLRYGTSRPAEQWNAQLSLLTGMAAAEIMLDGGTGILRTLPAADEHATRRVRRAAHALGIDWPTTTPYPEFVRGLDPARPEDAAMLIACTRLLRGAGYEPFTAAPRDTTARVHSAVASTYAHVTAPLRRLVDRYGAECCLAHAGGREVPDWVLEALPDLPGIMRGSSQRAATFGNAMVDLVEAALLAPAVGREFPGVVLEASDKDPRTGTIMIREPAIEARITAEQDLPVGADVRARLVEADAMARRVEFALA